MKPRMLAVERHAWLKPATSVIHLLLSKEVKIGRLRLSAADQGSKSTVYSAPFLPCNL